MSIELLIIRGGETQTTTGPASVIDGPLTDNGIKQSCLTAGWLNYNFVTSGYVGLVSPYTGTIQTASILSHVLNVPFVVDSKLRDYRPQNNSEVVVRNRSIPFGNLHWPVKDWSDEDVTFKPETPEEFVDRCVSLLCNIKELGYDKTILVTHATPGITLAELAIDKPVDNLKLKLREVAGLEKIANDNPTEIVERQMLLDGTPPCGLTLLANGQVHWFAKVVYE